MQQYEVPFFIWANYDIPEETGMRILLQLSGHADCTSSWQGFRMTNWHESFTSN
jgi:hypothetical protein